MTPTTGELSTGVEFDEPAWPSAPGVASMSTWSPTASPLAGMIDGFIGNGTSDWFAAGGCCAVSSEAVSSMPGCRSEPATCPTTWDNWLAGISCTPELTDTSAVPTAPDGMRAPAGTFAVITTTGTRELVAA